MKLYREVKASERKPPTHHVAIGLYDDGTASAYAWYNHDDKIWRYAFDGEGNLHAPEPEVWLEPIEITKESKSEDIFNGMATYTSPEGELYMNLREFQEATAIIFSEKVDETYHSLQGITDEEMDQFDEIIYAMGISTMHESDQRKLRSIYSKLKGDE